MRFWSLADLFCLKAEEVEEEQLNHQGMHGIGFTGMIVITYFKNFL